MSIPPEKNFPMPPLSSDSRILVTGGGEFLGQHLVRVLHSRFSVQSIDVQNPEGGKDFFPGSVMDAGQVDAALETTRFFPKSPICQNINCLI